MRANTELAPSLACMKVMGILVDCRIEHQVVIGKITVMNEEQRMAAESALLAGKSPDEVKVQLTKKPVPQDPKEQLEKEKLRLERTIQSLQKRLEEVERELESV